MDIHYSINRKFRRMFANILSVVAILAIAFPTMGSVYAQEANPRIIASVVGDWFWTTDFIPGSLSISIYASDEVGADLLWSGSRDADQSGFVLVGYDEHQVDLMPGNYLVISDGTTSKSLVLQAITLDVFDIDREYMAGTAPTGSDVWVAAGPQESQTGIWVTADPITGVWRADFNSILFDITEDMRPWSYAQIFDDDGHTNEADPPYSPFSWRDEFDGEMLAPGWFWENGDSGDWNLIEALGSLRIIASDTGAPDGNLLLKLLPPGDFTIKTHVLFEPDTNFQFAGLVIWQDEENFLQFGRAFCDAEGGCVGNGIYFDKILGGTFTDSNFATSIDNPSEVYLRLERRGDMIRAFYSNEGWSWYEIGTHWIPPEFQVNAVGLTASQDLNTPDRDVPADFDFFELNEGWGFLPEGFHDGEQGDVPTWACNANGWAADPDDRAVDVNIEVVVDDQTVANLVAGEYRQDLADAGVCVDGNCSFSTSLWETISSYEPHKVDTWAQDDSTGEWVLLSNSAKTLACRTYDIYTYDPLTGTTKQITNLQDTDEYNPSWSPNGKQIAHDVVVGTQDGPYQSIYITDVKTGVSTPLVGTENGGNDAVWSPNGKWIAFDRPDEPDPASNSSIYIVPSSGDTASFVRANAISPAWAPNGKRLVFQDQTDEAIRTISLDGGGETTIAASGANPAWSPDGNWIAYENRGDIWKVQVNVQGTTFGGPIQVTGGPSWDGHPSWSADSQTIVFHTGTTRDYDLWTVPAAGSNPTWLTGAPEFGDYDPAYARNNSSIAYGSFSLGMRLWASAYTYDYGTWSAGDHSYHFEATWTGGSEITDDIAFNVSDEVQSYDGYVLLRPGAVRAGVGCPAIDAIRPDQLTRFLAGYVTDYSMTYSEALDYFDSLSVSAVWDDGQSAELVRHEIIPFREDNWFDYVCTFTADLILDASQPDWVDSGITVSAGQSFTIQAFGLMNPCSDTYPNGAEICIFYTPVGADWVVPYENEFGIFPGLGLPFMALLGRIGDDEPFEVGVGGTFTAEQAGTLWFTPNDNLRTDNQGAYRVLVWPEP